MCYQCIAPIDGILVVLAEDREVSLVEVPPEPSAAAHRREGGGCARVVYCARKPFDGHRHGPVAQWQTEGRRQLVSFHPQGLLGEFWILPHCILQYRIHIGVGLYLYI